MNRKNTRRKYAVASGGLGDWSPKRILRVRYVGYILRQHNAAAAKRMFRLADYQEWLRWRHCKPGTRCGYTWCGECHDYSEAWTPVPS